MGILDVIPKIFKAKEAVRELSFLAKDADEVLLIDAPAFNIPLARAIKEKYPNKKVTYYILPKVWAWKKSRVKLIEKYADEAISIFPFEKSFFKNSTYHGNPLLDQITEYKDNVTENGVIAYLPVVGKVKLKHLCRSLERLTLDLIKRHFSNSRAF